jgi:hypothetical protein
MPIVNLLRILVLGALGGSTARSHSALRQREWSNVLRSGSSGCQWRAVGQKPLGKRGTSTAPSTAGRPLRLNIS